VELNVSENTVKTHTRRIFEKLEVQNRQELFDKADKFKD
jgi:DNA-binding NarL/FixJ family response regulator